jgi:hypothetical protein
MFQFTYKLKVAERVKGKCERHPRYNPERDGRGGIKGGCSACFSLYNLQQARLTLDAAHRDFMKKAVPGCDARGHEQDRNQEQTSSLIGGCCATLSHPPPRGGRQGPFPPLHLSPRQRHLKVTEWTEQKSQSATCSQP